MKNISTRKVVVVAVVGLSLVVAGCSGGGGGTPTPSANATATEGQGPGGVTPQTVDGQEIRSSTAAAMADAGSYTVRINTSTESTGPETDSTGISNQTIRVDLASQRGIRTSNQSFTDGSRTRTSTVAVYTVDNRSYREEVTPQGVFYETQNGSAEGFGAIRPVNVSSYQGNVTPVTATFDWEADGTETIDGTETVRYRSTNLTESSPIFDRANVTVVDASATLYVDDNNVLRRATLEYTLRNDNVTTRFELTRTLTDVGSTTVEEPKWVSDARAAANSG